jgi:CHAT domain-containing protein
MHRKKVRVMIRRYFFVVLSSAVIIVTGILSGGAAAQSEAPPYADIQALLDETTAILVYDTSASKVDVVKKSGVTTRELPKTEEPLEVKIGFFSDIIQSLNAMTPYQNESAEIYAILIQPIAGDLKGITRLGIVPDRTLSRLTFAALVSRRAPKRPHFLIDDYAVFYAPSPDLMKKALETDKSALTGGIVIGNAKYPAGFGVLKMAPLEMGDVTFFVKGSIMLEGDAAGESALKARLAEGPISVLHFTTHSSIKPGSDDSSKLILSGGGGDDGNLTVSETSTLKMDVDLVTISADDAGLTWKPSYGFPGAFMTAGASAVLAPLYKLDKGMTANLMNFFYSKLPDMDKAEALRQAQLMIIDFEKQQGRYRFAHPGFWASFVLVGSYK